MSPGDYHRFHFPTDWKIKFRRHIFGYLLGVFSWNIWRKGDIFSNNERVVYFGEWAHGALFSVLVGAYNVGSIEIFFDSELCTNKDLKKEKNPYE